MAALSAQCPPQQELAAYSPCLPALHAFSQSPPHFWLLQQETAVLSARLRLQDFASLPLQHAALSFPAQHAGSFPSVVALA